MYEYSLGITSGDARQGQAGYKHFILQPTVGPLYSSLEGTYESNYGPVSVKWTADGKGTLLTYEVTVPANTTATLYLPGKGSETHLNHEVTRMELESGTYKFTNTDGVWK